MSSPLELLGFWGKAQPRGDASVSWHPVAYHLLDVAAVAEAILAARPIARARAGRLLGLDPADAARLLVALIALHDLGKFAPAFQVKAPEFWPAALGRCDPTRVRPGRHVDDGYVLWTEALRPLARELLWPQGIDALDALAPAIFGHHGRPVRTAPSDGVRTIFGAAREPAVACAEAVLALLMPTPLDAAGISAERARLASWWVAGLTSVADWIGSKQEWFAYTAPIVGDESLGAYWARARRIAADAVRACGLHAPEPAPPASFAALTGGKAPTPVQRWAEDVELPDGSLLVVIEDVTGAGKTEAAQMLVHRLMTAGRAAGAYWAMPTQATANAMYARQDDALGSLFAGADGGANGGRPSLVLAHGQQRLHERFRATVLSTEPGATLAAAARESSDDEPSTAACAAFLADDSRAALLADLGAGTIDQALLGVLPSKYNAIRLFGLADKVLVIDEAHAYDAYTSVELEELLRFQAALGGCAVVLSATLSRKQREAFAGAWMEGTGRRRQTRGMFSAPEPWTRCTAYPLATLVARGEESVRETALEAAPWSRRDIGVRLVHTVDDALGHVLDAARAGGAVVWVRNSVDDCLEAAALLRDHGVEPLVFHARFAQGDRQRREQEVLALFGRSASLAERRGRVLVATQVIEQSLDLDFDAMVSDLAPVDLLVQRAGRLRRHPEREASRPPGFACELVVLAPPFAEEPPSGWLGGPFRRTAYVYANTGVLWRTVRALRDAGAIRTPRGLRPLIAGVYDADPDAVPASLRPVAERAEGKEKAHAAAARYATLAVTDGYDGSAQAWVSELRSQTRLGDQQTTVRLGRVLADGTLAPWADAAGPAWKAWALSEVRLSAWRVPAGSMAETRYAAAVSRARAAWGKWEQEIPLVPLVEVAAGDWRATVSRPDGSDLSLGYDPMDGLTYRLP